jgi:hypothetical protein
MNIGKPGYKKCGRQKGGAEEKNKNRRKQARQNQEM